jgi:hypothetical protein
MTATVVMTDRADRLSVENYRLRELLKRWVRTERFPLSRDEFSRLCDETKRALHRLGPQWADEDD